MTEEVLFTQKGQIGLITLNRPNALNALTLTMIKAMQKQLELWKNDSNIKAVVLAAAPGNAFCAGGDVRWLYQTGKDQDPEQMQFFWHEYRLNHFIHYLGKPYLSLMDGITMGGGVGVSLHGSHPIASERFVFAMPETSIGFFPDIGASYLLNRCSGDLGIYLGLTGNRLGPEEAQAAGLIKALVKSERMPLLLDALIKADWSQEPYDVVDACIKSFAETPTGTINQHKLIDSCFAKTSIEKIREALQQSGDTWSAETLSSIDKKSPLSLKITLAQLQKTKGLDLGECLKIDYDLVGHFMQGSDFYEGVRALLVDKDKNPRWQPASLDLVTEKMVVNYFEREDQGLVLIN
ncbi:MAG: enoyl-CoA hydratase/isomerase family protein [Legionella sp.]|nr:MAG: enoyl-CoA hydratase/isomerase family protein [Legionella sp.]